MGTPKVIKGPVTPQESGTNTLSRRSFIAATAATGIAVGVGQSAMASPQVLTSHPEYPLPKAEPELFMGTAAGAMLAQLRAAGVRTLFHTNVSGNVPFFEAIEAAGDVQVINVTHEGQGVAAAAGFAMASKGLGFFFGGHIGTGNAMSNLYNAWKDRVPLLLCIGGATGRGLARGGWPGAVGQPARTLPGVYHVDRNAGARGCNRHASPCDEIRIWPAKRACRLWAGAPAARNRFRRRFTRSISATMRYKSRAERGVDPESRAMAGGSAKIPFLWWAPKSVWRERTTRSWRWRKSSPFR